MKISLKDLMKFRTNQPAIARWLGGESFINERDQDGVLTREVEVRTPVEVVLLLPEGIEFTATVSFSTWWDEEFTVGKRKEEALRQRQALIRSTLTEEFTAGERAGIIWTE